MYFNCYLIIKDDYGNEYTIWASYEYIYSDSVNIYGIQYTFNETGHYEVVFELVDDIGASWYAYCYWDVYDPSTTDDPTDDPTESTPPVLAGFSWAIYMGALAVVVIPVALRRRKNY